jgi:anthranilate synthase component 1
LATHSPTLEEVRQLGSSGGTIPIVRRLLGDHLTPVSVFARLGRPGKRAFLLESVVGGEQIARYSFVGIDPEVVLRVKNGVGHMQHAAGKIEANQSIRDPLAELHALLARHRAVPIDSWRGGPMAMPRFTGGAVGYAGYDLTRYYEKLPGSKTDDRSFDDLDFGIYEQMVVFDHVNKTMLIIAHARLEGDRERAYNDAVRKIDAMVERLSAPAEPLHGELNWGGADQLPLSDAWSRPEFVAAVDRAKEYIGAGDIFQVVLSRRVSCVSAADPFDVYRALRVVNPSPFMFYLQSPECVLVGASPEILCRVEDGVVTNRPLAGTRRRGVTSEEDAALERELLADPKDRAEHIMLVDLGRNDLGRVCVPGSIRLSEVMSVERYSHVMHLSSQVCGTLAPGKTAMDALRSCLPVGTVSGAPKVRAMQIIDELEPHRRGPYGGGVGYFDFAGNMDMCIALRTMVVTPDQRGGWRYDVQAGAGIVADSVPELEFEETVNKARAMLTAIAMAQGMGG